MSSQPPTRDPGKGGFKGSLERFGTKLKIGLRGKGSRVHKGSTLPVPTAGEGYESSTHSAGHSRSTTPVPKESDHPATPGTADSALGPVPQAAPHRPSIKDLPTVSTGNDHNLQHASEPIVDVSMASSASDNNASSAPDFSVPVSTQGSNRTARLWFDAATGFGKTLLKKLPDFVDSNPVKVVAAIVKVAIEAAETVGANKDNLTRLSTRLESLGRLEVIEDGIPTGAEEIHTTLKEALSNASAKVSHLTTQSSVLQTISYEQYSREIQGVFDAIDDAVQTFQVQIASRIEAEATQILAMARDEKLHRFNPSMSAYYNRVVEGQRIRREECTKGTRVGILDNIATWARDDSPQSPLVYWLTGQAGSGKTTIATSIAAKFSRAIDGITLGANFFCSRNAPETNTTRRIVPTIAYQLARSCDPFTQALIVPSKLDKLDAVSSPVHEQLQSLFFVPWVQCEARRSHQRYLIIIDALDELKDNGSTEFLGALFALFEASPVNGVKIFITSRPEDRIVKRIESFHSRTIARLQEVPLKDVSPDIRKYLESQLPTLGNDNLDKLRDSAAGLFIYAATAVRCIKPRDDTSSDDQNYLLEEFLKYTRNAGTGRPDFIVDELYQQIMGAALHHYIRTPKLLAAHLGAIHLALSTGERVSAAAIAALFNKDTESKGYRLTEKTVMSVVQTGLHAVLYVKDGLIFWYHASFPDFIFDSLRSNFIFTGQDGKAYDCQFTCDEENQQTWLRNLCFSKLKELRFNICSIPSSFDLDQDHRDMLDALLVYSAVNWSHHLPITGDAGAGDIGELLNLRALFWIELMNIIERVGDCVPILERAQRWVRQHIDIDTAALDERLSEVIAFARDFPERTGFLNKKPKLPTPHLYISQLAVWSEGPKTIQPWKEHFRNLPFITHSRKDIPVIFTAKRRRLFNDKRVALKVKSKTLTSAVFLNKGAQILSGYADGSISIWDASTGTLQVRLEVGEQQLSTHNEITAITRFNDCVCVWNRLERGSVHFIGNTHNLSKGFWSIAASADSTKIRSESLTGKIYIWGLVSGRWQLVSQFKSTDPSAQGSVSPNTACLLNMMDNNTHISIHKVTPAGPPIPICPPLENAPSVAICQRGTKLQIVYGRKPNDLKLLYLEHDHDNDNILQEQTSVLPYSNRFDSVTISPDASTIAAKGWIWNHVTGNQCQLPYNGSTLRVRSLAISEDNKLLLYCDYTSIRLCDISGDTKSGLLKEDMVSDGDFRNWELQEDGWIVSSQTRDRLMWVPSSFREEECFAVPSIILLISEGGYYSVDFSKSKLGGDWAECYTPTTSLAASQI